MGSLMSKITYTTISSDESIHPRFERALKEVEHEFGQHHPFFIDNEKITSPDGEFEDRSPIDKRIVLGYFQKATRGHVSQAIASSKSKFPEWADREWRDRVTIMRRAAELCDEDMFSLSALMTYETGKSRTEAIAEACEVSDIFRYYADQMEAKNGFVMATGGERAGEPTHSIMRPHGVWAVISPFNFPMALAAQMATGALLTGNSVVFKPASDAPFSGMKLYEIYIRAGVPTGVINFVTGPGSSFSEEVTQNADVAGIAFTGSRDVGLRLYKKFVRLQEYPKPFLAEMGSKNPAIVTAKADLDKAVEGVVRGAFGFGNQKCSATSRVYVQVAVKDAFIKRLVDRVSQLTVGDPRRREVFLGPLINDRALKNYQRHIELARKDNGKILTGGEVLSGNELTHGYFVAPTVITGLPSDHSLFKEELFVPILLVDTYDTLDEAFQKANDTEYGLTAGIFSQDGTEVEKFFRRIEFGVTYANRRSGATTGAWPGVQSFCGWKASGCSSKGVGGPYYLPLFMREQSRTVVEG
jgi:1-pyrroline-5-carboxylate dehydrogenase